MIATCLLRYHVLRELCRACATRGGAVERSEATEIERFFQYFVYLRALPLEALSREYTRQEAAFAQSHSAEDRLRLVLLLSLPDTDFGNRLYALELLQAYLNEPEPLLQVSWTLLFF